MVSIYKKLNNIPTHLMVWDNVFDNQGEDVIVCVTGNPGVPDFYIEFASKLYENTRIPVCVIGHAGNEHIPEIGCCKLENSQHKYGLRGQIEHKIDLVRSIHPNSKIHLIGHSIGAWVALEMLEENMNLLPRIKTINLLFPTIEKMATTKNGLFLNVLVRPFHYLILLAVFMFHLLPRFLKLFAIQLYLMANSLPDYLDNRILKLTYPGALNKILCLAYEEMDYVDEMNTEILDTVKGITNVIYTKKDCWVPNHFSEDINVFEPEISIREVDADHSFVFLSSEPIADLVSEFILSRTKNKQIKTM